MKKASMRVERLSHSLAVLCLPSFFTINFTLLDSCKIKMEIAEEVKQVYTTFIFDNLSPMELQDIEFIEDK